MKIGSLRLYSRTGTRTGWSSRVYIEHLLASADLRPPGLPPSAVLIVRQMLDPLPGKLAKSPGAVRVSQEWERQARRQMAEFYRRAARPADGPVPAGAEAVLFQDECELLACLLRDLVHGPVVWRWWWQGVLRNALGGRVPGSRAEAVEAAARNLELNAHLAPAILARLEVESRGAAAVRLLSAEQAGRVLHAMLWAYRLVLPPPVPEQEPALPPSPIFSPRQWLELGRERSALLGLGMDLFSRPQSARSAGYLQLLYRWLNEETILPDATQPPVVGEIFPVQLAGRAEGLGGAEQPRPFPEASQSALSWPSQPSHPPPAATPQPGDQEQVKDMGETAGRQPARPHVEAAAGYSQPEAARPGRRRVVDTGSLSAPEGAADPRFVGSQAAARVELPAVEIQPGEEYSPWHSGGLPTRLGGVLYLINLMTALDLPGCFEEGWRLSSGVGPWGLLEALAHALLGEELAGLEDDPLWPALAQLDGRQPGELPGSRLPRSRPRRWPEFSLPERWLQGLPAVKGWGGKLTRRQQRTWAASASPLLDRWLDLALPFISYRLRLALRLPSKAGPGEALLLLPGRLYATSTHIDLAASVEATSLPVRMAGLDRDPGWLPEFGRVVLFHFNA